MWIKVDKKTLEGFVGVDGPSRHHQSEEQIKMVAREAVNPNTPSPLEKAISGIKRYDPGVEGRAEGMDEHVHGDYVELHELLTMLAEERLAPSAKPEPEPRSQFWDSPDLDSQGNSWERDEIADT